MTAHRTTDDLSAFLDEELTDEERALLEEQLDDDAGLRAELEELRGVVDGVRSLGDARAPEGFLGAVLARVDAGEGLGEDLFPEDGSANEAPTPLPSVGTPSSPEDNVVRFPWWLRGPAVAAVAAALVVGIGLSLRDPGPSEPPSVAELTTRPAGAPGAPVPTGAVEDAGDAVVALDPEELPTGGAESIRMEPRGADRVAVGGAGTGATPPPPPAASKPHSSGLREADAGAPDGVVEVAAEAFAPEPDAVADAADEDEESDDLMPAVVRNSALGMAPSSAGADPGERAALSAVASLRTGRRDAIGALQDAARQRGWTLQFVSPAGGPLLLSDHQTEQVVVLEVPSGQEAAAQRVFDQLGTFGFSSTPTSFEGDTSQLRVTVIFQQP